jgi:hypothetical protein
VKIERKKCNLPDKRTIESISNNNNNTDIRFEIFFTIFLGTNNDEKRLKKDPFSAE